MTSLAAPRAPGFLARASHWTLARIPLYIVAVIVPVTGFEWATHFLVPVPPSPYHAPLRIVLNLGGAVLALWIYRRLVRRFEHRDATELDVLAGALPFVAGVALGAGLIAAIVLVLWSVGVARFAPGDGGPAVWTGLVTFFCVAVFEELTSRAVVFRLFEQAGGTTVAIALSSLLFGFAHAFNENATLASSVDIAVEAGTLLALAYALTRNLWFAAGIHLGWNYAEGDIFGGAVSGADLQHAFVNTSLTGPDWLTGGAFGLEASAPALGACLAACGILFVLVRRRGHWLPATRFRCSLP